MNKKFTSFFLIFAVIGFYFSPFSNVALATGSLTNISDTMSSQKVSNGSTHLIKFRTPTALDVTSSGSSIIIAFPSTYDFTGSVIGDITMKDGPTTGLENTETLAASPSASAWGAVFTDGNCSASKKCTLTLTNPTDGVGAHDIIINDYVTVAYTVTHNINPSSPGTQIVTITTTSDAGTLAEVIISNDVVVVSAVVDPTLSFSISDNTIFFGALKATGTSCWAQGADPGDVTCPTTVETEANNMVAATNATSGYAITLSGATLTSGSNTIDKIGDTATAPSIGSEQFGVRFNAAGGAGVVETDYGTSGQYAFNTTTQPSQIAHTTGPSANTTYSARYIANISNVTQAGAYTTSITYTITGNF